MEVTDSHNERMAKLTFSSVYPHYLVKVEKKGRTKEELHQVIRWLTGFTDQQIDGLIAEKVTFDTFFRGPNFIPTRHL